MFIVCDSNPYLGKAYPELIFLTLYRQISVKIAKIINLSYKLINVRSP